MSVHAALALGLRGTSTTANVQCAGAASPGALVGKHETESIDIRNIVPLTHLPMDIRSLAMVDYCTH